MKDQPIVATPDQQEAAKNRATASGIAFRQKKRHKLRRINPEFDLSLIRCAVESSIQERITGDADLMKRLKAVSADAGKYLAQQRLRLITEAFIVDEAITPKLYDLGQNMMRLLRLSHPLDIFVIPGTDQNAFCAPSRKGNRLVMGLHAGLLASMNRRELLFVMGHEVGHALLRHAEIPHVGFENTDFSPLEVIRMRALDRAREISCDRFGLVACQDIRVASTVLFKLASGLTESWFTFNEVDYARHFDRLSSMAELVSIENVSRTHPLMPLRVKALIDFSRSDSYAQAFGRSGEISAAELDKGVESMLSVLLPDMSHLEDAKLEETIGQFLVDGAVLLISADGVIDPNEVKWLQDRCRVDWSRGAVHEQLDDPEFKSILKERIRQNADIISHKLPESDRGGVLHTMCEVAFSASGLHQAEVEILNEMRVALGIRVEIAQAALKDAERNVETNDAPVKSGPLPETPITAKIEATPLMPPGMYPHADNLTKWKGVELMHLLEQVITDVRLTTTQNAGIRAMFPGITEQYETPETAIRALIAWAITTGSRGGPLTRTESVRLILSAITIFRSLNSRFGKSMRQQGTPVEKRIRDQGAVVLFHKGEGVFWVKDMTPFVVKSVLMSRQRIQITPPEDPNATEVVMPHHLLKDPVNGYWPPELTL